MNKKVSLREIVGTKIVYAIILVAYYWMWARSDWEAWYVTAQNVLTAFLIMFFAFQAFRIAKYKKEGTDELAEQNLKRCDSICLKIFIALMILAAWAAAIIGHVELFTPALIGWWIVIAILAITIIRTILFIVMDSKGV